MLKKFVVAKLYKEFMMKICKKALFVKLIFALSATFFVDAVKPEEDYKFITLNDMLKQTNNKQQEAKEGVKSIPQKETDETNNEEDAFEHVVQSDNKSLLLSSGNTVSTLDKVRSHARLAAYKAKLFFTLSGAEKEEAKATAQKSIKEAVAESKKSNVSRVKLARAFLQGFKAVRDLPSGALDWLKEQLYSALYGTEFETGRKNLQDWYELNKKELIYRNNLKESDPGYISTKQLSKLLDELNRNYRTFYIDYNNKVKDEVARGLSTVQKIARTIDQVAGDKPQDSQFGTLMLSGSMGDYGKIPAPETKPSMIQGITRRTVQSLLAE